MKPKSALRSCLALAGSTVLAISYSHAADGTWNVDANGLWGTNTNWLSNVIADGSGFTANFTNDITADRTVSLDGDRTLTSVVFGDSDTATAGSWILNNNGNSANNLILAGTTPGITVNALGTAKTATISAIIQGTAGLVKSGSGTLILSGVNTYTGLTTVSNGELQWGATNALSTGNLTIEDGGTANIATFTDTVGTITLNQGGTISGTTGVLAGNTGLVFNGGGTVSGFTTGALAFGVPSPATTNVVLTYNDVGVSTTQNIDRLYLSTTTTGGNRTFTINDGDAAVDLDITSYLGLSSTFTNSSAYNLYKDGAGVMQLSGSTSNSLWGSDSKLYINEGTLLLNKSSGVALPGVSGRLTIGDDGGAAGSESVIVRYASGSSSNQIEFGTIVINGDGLLDLNGFSETIANLTHSSGGSITTGAGTLTSTGFNTTTISGTSTLTGNLNISSSSSAAALTIGGTADINGTTTLGSTGGITSTGTPTIRGTLALGTTNHPIVVTSGNLTISAEITGTTNTITKSGAGTLTLSSATSGFTKAISVTDGTLKLGAAGGGTNTPLGTTAGTTSVSGTGTLDLNGYTLGTAEALNIRGSGTSNSGALANTGAAASYSGLVTLGAAARIVATGDIALTNVGTITGATFGLTLDGTSTNSSIASIIGTTTGTLTKTGSGKWTLSGSNTYSGLTTVNEGTLLTTKAAALPNYTTLGKVSVASGATLAVNVDSGGWNATQINNLLTPANWTAGSKLGIDVTGTFTYSNDIGTTQTAKGLVKSGAGTLVLDTTHTYTGATEVNAGTLQLGSGTATGALSTSSAISVASGATFAVNQTDTVTQGTDFSSAAITGAGGFTQAGSGTTVLNAANSYTGATAVNAGTLQLGSGTATGALSTSSAISVASGATFAVNQTDTVTQGTDFSSAAITGAGGFTQAGSGTTVLNTTNSYTGATTVSAGKLVINGDQTAATGATTVSGAGTRLGGNGTLGGDLTIQSGAIHAPGNGPGLQTIRGATTYDSGSIFEWDLAANVHTATGTRGTDYDAVNISGAFTVDSAAIFKVIENTGVNFADAFWDTNRTWTDIFNVTGSVTSGWSATAVDIYNTSGVLQDYSVEGSFTITGTTLNWNTFAAIPEPTSALAGLLLGAGLLRRRRAA